MNFPYKLTLTLVYYKSRKVEKEFQIIAALYYTTSVIPKGTQGAP